jgi:hypothetical protein
MNRFRRTIATGEALFDAAAEHADSPPKISESSLSPQTIHTPHSFGLVRNPSESLEFPQSPLCPE